MLKQIHKLSLKAAFVVMALCFAQSASAQSKVTVNGTVSDSHGDPVIGAFVLEAGTQNAAVSDLDGRYTLSVSAKSRLQVSLIGYKTRTLNVEGAGRYDFVLEEDQLSLEDVLVVGYTTSTKRDLIASVSQVKTEEISGLPVSNMVQGLAGRSPGLIVSQNGGGINNVPAISIRGGGEPLYVIDGVIRDKNDFASLSSDDIAQMNILKDASATAIYGARASNGIVQVVTKSGERGAVHVEYDFNQSFAQPGIWPEQLPSYTRAEYANTAYANDGREAPFTAEAIQAMKDGSQPLTFNNTDWRSLVLKDWAPQQKHNARVYGGSENNRFYASLGHVNQQSLYRTGNHWMERTNFRIADEVTIKPIGLQINAALDGYRQYQTHPYTSTANSYYYVFSHINNKSPLEPGVNKYGLPYNVTDNPVAETAEDAGYNRNIYNVLNARGEIIWRVPWVNGLRFRASTDYRYYAASNKQWRKDAAKYEWDSQVPMYDNKPLLYNAESNSLEYTNQAFAEYSGTFGSHNVSALAGYEQYYISGQTYWAQREDYDFDIDQMNVGSANSMKNGGSEYELGRASWIGHVKYDYASRYYLEASVRVDGSDYFAPGKRWGTFFGGSAGWLVSNEKWMKGLVDSNALNLLKFRVSYGETGLDSSAGRFAYLTSYNLNTQAYVSGGKYISGFTEGSLPSPDLTWYTTRQTNAGFDFASLGSRLYGSFDYFYYSTKGYLTAPTGKSYVNTAIGIGMPKVKSESEYRREGFEIQLGWKDSIGDFYYDVSGNMTYFNSLWARNEDESEASYMNPYTRTQQQTGYYGTMWHNLGYYSSAQDVYDSVNYLNAINSGKLTAGDIKYEDVNGDGLIDANDNRRVGSNSMPRCQFGLNIQLGWRGFYFSTLFQGSSSFDMYLTGTATMQTGQAGSLPVIFPYQTDFWTPTNTSAQYPRLMSNTGGNANNNYQTSDFWLIDGAYIRMKDIQFGYDFKNLLLKNVKWISRLKVGVSGQNIFTVSQATKYGLDPENASTTGYAYPVERTLALNFNIGF